MRLGRLAAAAMAAFLTACGAASSGSEGTIRVFAAASLTEALATIGADFERGTGVRVDAQFGGSSALARQIVDGASVDVFVSADEDTMDRVADANLVETPEVIARNRLVLLVPAGNPAGIKDIRDLSRSDLLVVLCAPLVPCGRLAAAALERAGVRVRPASLEESVKGVVAKVTLGEADAGIAYASDAVAAAASTDMIAVPDAGMSDLEAVYPAAVLKQTRERSRARAFVDYLRSTRGQRRLSDAGFVTVSGA